MPSMEIQLYPGDRQCLCGTACLRARLDDAIKEVTRRTLDGISPRELSRHVFFVWSRILEADRARIRASARMRFAHDVDHAGKELVDLASQDDREGFNELASLLMPPKDVEECWSGVRQRLGKEVK